MFGCLHTLRKERGLAPVAKLYVPPAGCNGFDLDERLDLPLDKIEGLFINNHLR